MDTCVPSRPCCASPERAGPSPTPRHPRARARCGAPHHPALRRWPPAGLGRALCATALAAGLAAPSLPAAAGVVGTVGAGVTLARADGSTLHDAKVVSSFTGSATATAGLSLLWPLPPDPSEVQGVFGGTAEARANTSTLDLHAYAGVGGTRTASQEFAVANALLDLRFAFAGPAGTAFPVSFVVDLHGANEVKPLPGEEAMSLGRGSLSVRADGLTGGKAGDPIGEMFNQFVAISSRPAENSPSSRMTVAVLAESGRPFTFAMALQAVAQFNGVADFSRTATLSSIDVPLAWNLQIDGVELLRDGSQYTVAGQIPAVPGPPGWLLMACGLAGLRAVRRR